MFRFDESVFRTELTCNCKTRENSPFYINISKKVIYFLYDRYLWSSRILQRCMDFLATLIGNVFILLESNFCKLRLSGSPFCNAHWLYEVNNIE